MFHTSQLPPLPVSTHGVYAYIEAVAALAGVTVTLSSVFLATPTFHTPLPAEPSSKRLRIVDAAQSSCFAKPRYCSLHARPSAQPQPNAKSTEVWLGAVVFDKIGRASCRARRG